MKRSLHEARTCYKHMAGKLGTGLCQRFIDLDWVKNDGTTPIITKKGLEGFTELGIDIKSLLNKRKPAVRFCLDTSERKPHLAGMIGELLLEHFFDCNWAWREGETRKLIITSEGKKQLNKLGINI